VKSKNTNPNRDFLHRCVDMLTTSQQEIIRDILKDMTAMESGSEERNNKFDEFLQWLIFFLKENGIKENDIFATK